MKTLARPALAAALVLVLAGCASSSGQPWTPPPPASAVPETPAASVPASAAPSGAPESAAPSVAASAGASQAPAEGRIIELELTKDLEIKQDGAKVSDIPVTPGETVTFRVTNTAGFVHNFWIGPDADLAAGKTDGLTGHADWEDTTPVDITWTVPDDPTGIKFGCTVPGHYLLMNGTFSVVAGGEPTGAPTSAAPATLVPATVAPSTVAPATVAPSVSASAGSSAEPAARVVELELNSSLQITSGGAQVKDIPVTPGETIIFKLTNTAGMAHNFWIGPDTALMNNQTTGLVGIPDWTDAEPKELTWVVPDDATSLKFGCTVPGHYMLMNGTFSAAS